MRAELIDFYTFGETKSAKDITDEQVDKLFQLIQKIRRGKLDIRYDANGKLYLEEPSGKRYKQ